MPRARIRRPNAPRQFLAIVDALLGGGRSPFSIADLEPVTVQLNSSFDGEVPSPFAQDNLVNGACVCAGQPGYSGQMGKQ